MLTNIQINNFQLTGQIGSGSYGLVFHAVDLITEGKYAIKAVMKQQPSTKAGEGVHDNTIKIDGGVRKSAVLQTQLYHFFKSFQNRVFLPVIDLNSIKSLTEKQLENAPHYREVSMHIAVHSHNNIVTIHQVLESSLAIFIVMDYHPCDLFTSIVNKQHFAENGMLVKKVFLQLCSAVLHCHRVGIYHCDIKPENILIDDQDNIYICDFGLATTAMELATNVCVGSSYYMPPERICAANGAQKFRTELGDIWSIGIILINLTCIRNPWLKADHALDSTFRYFLRDSSVIKKILPISEDLYQILCTVLQVDPLLRTDISSLMEAVSGCEHFTTHGPLGEVAPLTVEQYTRFVEGDYAAATRSSLEEYYSDYLGELDEFHDDSEQDLREDGLASYLEEDLLEDYDTSTGGSLTVPQLHKNSTGLEHKIPLDCLQLSLSTDTNFSGFSRWLPNYSTCHEYKFDRHVHD